jgi:hypothetical protein
MPELLTILLILAAGWFWLDSMRARESAVAVAKRVCSGDGVQLLDDTVAVAGLWVWRRGGGGLQIRRTYRFEFSDTGDNRRPGTIVMLGSQIETVYLEPTHAGDSDG